MAESKPDGSIQAWTSRVLSAVMAVLLGITAWNANQMSAQIERNRVSMVEQDKAHLSLIAGLQLSVARIDLTRFTDDEGDAMKAMISQNQMAIMREFYSLKESIAKLPPQPWRDRIVALERAILSGAGVEQ